MNKGIQNEIDKVEDSLASIQSSIPLKGYVDIPVSDIIILESLLKAYRELLYQVNETPETELYIDHLNNYPINKYITIV